MSESSSSAPCIWVVDDDRAVRFVLCTALREAGYQVVDFDSAAPALQALAESPPPALLFTDVRMPGDDGLVLLDKLKAALPQLPVVVMSAYTDVASTAGAFRGGAHEFLSKPFDLDDAVALAQRVLPAVAPAMAAPTPAADAASNQPPQLVGDTPPMRALFRAIGRLAQAPLAVLIIGETGTGKELVANALHRESPRAQHPFVALNTAAIPAELLESELFGHEAGAFTGAQRRHIGRFEQANGGTLFLDEIGDMPIEAQTRLLRVLQSGEFTTVGGARIMRANVRIVAATNRELQQAVANGQFREDLYYRLNVVPIELPALRERREDIAILARHFLERAADAGLPRKVLNEQAVTLLRDHDWPGNVRQLENLMRRLAALSRDDQISAGEVAAMLGQAGGHPASVLPDVGLETAVRAFIDRLAKCDPRSLDDGTLYDRLLSEVERPLIEVMLARHGGNQLRASRAIGLNRNTLRKRLDTLGIDPARRPPAPETR